MNVEGINYGLKINTVSITDLLERLNVGDVFKAQVIDITVNEVLLKLFDGSTISAQSSVPLDIQKGDLIEFRLKDKNEAQIFLETIKTNPKVGVTPKDENGLIRQQLIDLGIKPDKINQDIVFETNKHNLPISKELIITVSKLLNKDISLDIPKAVFLSASNITPVKNNIEMLNGVIEGKLKIGRGIENLIKDLSSIQDPVVSELIQKNISVFDVIRKAIMEVPAIKAPIINPEELIEPTINNSIVSEVFNKEKSLQITKNIGSNEIPKFIINKDLIGLNIEGVSNLINGPIDNENDNATENIPNKDIRNQMYDREILVRNSVSDSLKGAFERLSYQSDVKDLNVKELYKELYAKLEVIRGVIEQSVIPNKTDVITKIEYLHDNIRFLNEVNNFNSYLQIPLNIFDKHYTGELYVLKKESKRKKIDPENITLFISLNTYNLGQVESMISINKKNISINMRLESREIEELVKKKVTELYKTISDIGYKLVDIRYQIIEQPVNILNINDIAKFGEEVRKSIDLRI